MKFSNKIILFFLAFTTLFYWLHVNSHYNIRALLADLGGIPWLYSSMVTLFSIIAGFVIQKEWENWNNLVDATKSEVDSLGKLWLWSRHLPEQQRDKFDVAIRTYLEEMSATGLEKSSRGEHSQTIDKSFNMIQSAMFEMSEENSKLMVTTFSFFTKLIDNRSDRIHHASHHIPEALRRTLPLFTFLIIILSFFIGIKSIWLDYIFTLSVSLVSYVIYIIIDDLNNPLKPGSWHLTSEDYKKTLEAINSRELSSTHNKVNN